MRDVLNQMFDNILEGVPEYLRRDVRSSAFIAGGAIASLATNTRVRDVDVFFTDKSVYLELRAALKGRHGYTEGPNSFKVDINDISANFIGRISGRPDEVVNTFDFLHTHSYYIPATQELYIHPASYRTELIYNANQALSPAVSMRRVFRFLNRGYTIAMSEVNKIIEDIAALDKTDEATMRYNFIGVGHGFY